MNSGFNLRKLNEFIYGTIETELKEKLELEKRYNEECGEVKVEIWSKEKIEKYLAKITKYKNNNISRKEGSKKWVE